MLIKDLFQKDIARPINGVVKADQLDESSVWQELDEFVITKELDGHFRRFFQDYAEAIERPGDSDIAGRIGVWVSGFFGSGKSHFIKVLSYLLRNEQHRYDGETKHAAAFFNSKVKDAMLLGDIKRAVASHADVILFNIDSKADHKDGRDAILRVFLKVLNELAGYSSHFPQIAHMERHLAREGQLDHFHAAYEDLTGASWVDKRDAWEFHQDEIVDALSQVLKQSKESVRRWIDSASDNFSLTVETFCQLVREHIDARGRDHHIIFLVDEVGQFIGADTHMMLNLQTLIEELGTECGGRAWVVVTAQEDIDAVLGEFKGSRANDFSKIQGRFKMRLSLSSANVDEVIRERLLAKKEDVRDDLASTYFQERDNLRNQLSFRDIGMTLPDFTDGDDFLRNYPVIPYQFKLLQKIFESIRKAGATGIHLAHGARSLLDAFQHAVKSVSECEVGVLIPLYRFYPSIENFLDTSVKRTINQASGNTSLQAFDATLLKVLFLIRYVDEIKGNVDNLVTLCLDEIDADRLALRTKIEESLMRLERETLVNRSGDTYFFLSREERDIMREIRRIEVSSGDEVRVLGNLVFDDVLKGQRKHRFGVTRKDYSFNRVCDGHPLGQRIDGGLNVSVITPLAEEFSVYQGTGPCIIKSTDDSGQVLIVLKDEDQLGRELRVFIQTNKFLRTRNDGTLSPTTKRILSDLADENRLRRVRLSDLLGELITRAAYYVAGQQVESGGSDPVSILANAMDYLIQNTFPKMDYLETLCEDPVSEVETQLIRLVQGQTSLVLDDQESNSRAIEDLRKHIELCAAKNLQIVLYDLVARYERRPYGWPEFEVILLLVRLFAASTLRFVDAGAEIPREKLRDVLTSKRRWKSVKVIPRPVVPIEIIIKSVDLGKKIFLAEGPKEADLLAKFLRGHLEEWRSNLRNFRFSEEEGRYPGGKEVADGLRLVQTIMGLNESLMFLNGFVENSTGLLTLSEDLHELSHFFGYQLTMWKKLRAARDRFQVNQMDLERNEAADRALNRMNEILDDPKPYAYVKEGTPLIRTVEEVNERLLDAQRIEALKVISGHTTLVNEALAAASADESQKSQALKRLKDLKQIVVASSSIAQIAYAESKSVLLKDVALDRIGPKPPRPHPKPPCEIFPKDHVTSSYLESQSDVNAFLEKLCSILTEALKRNERIRIR